jgi:hypothetical protein
VVATGAAAVEERMAVTRVVGTATGAEAEVAAGAAAEVATGAAVEEDAGAAGVEPPELAPKARAGPGITYSRPAV